MDTNNDEDTDSGYLILKLLQDSFTPNLGNICAAFAGAVVWSIRSPRKDGSQDENRNNSGVANSSPTWAAVRSYVLWSLGRVCLRFALRQTINIAAMQVYGRRASLTKDYALFVDSVSKVHEMLSKDMGALPRLRHSMWHLFLLSHLGRKADSPRYHVPYRHLNSTASIDVSSSTFLRLQREDVAAWAHYARCAASAYGYYILLAVSGRAAVFGAEIGDHSAAIISHTGSSLEIIYNTCGDGPTSPSRSAPAPPKVIAGDDPLPWTDKDVMPCCFVAIDHLRKSLILSVRGTAEFTDVAADLASRAVDASDLFEESNTRILAHEGVLRAARMLVASCVGDLVEEHVRRLPKDYKLVMTGHSLGGAIATLASLLLLKRLERSSHHPHCDTKFDEPSPQRQILCYAFGPPPCLVGDYVWPGHGSNGRNRSNSDSSDEGHWSLSCLSFINRDDPVPSLCLRSCYELVGDLLAVDKAMPEMTWLGSLRMLLSTVFATRSRTEPSDEELLLENVLSQRERWIDPTFQQIARSVPFLTIPGRVVQIVEAGPYFNKRKNENIMNTNSGLHCSMTNKPDKSTGRINIDFKGTPPPFLLQEIESTADLPHDRILNLPGPRSMMFHSFSDYVNILSGLAKSLV